MNMAVYSPAEMSVDTRGERLEASELMLLIRRNFWLMLLVALAVTGATAVYLSTVTPTYRAQAAMVLTNSEIRMSQIDTQLQSYELTRARVETELDVLRSRSFAEQVAKSIGLFNDPAFRPIPDDTASASGPAAARAVVDKLLASYALHRSGESLVISVQGEARTPELAARIANGVIESFIELSRVRQTTTIENSISHLNTQISQISDDLSQMQFDLAGFIRQFTLDDAGLADRLRSEDSHLTSILQLMNSENRLDTPEARRISAKRVEIEQQLAERTRNELELKSMHRSVDLLVARYEIAVERLNDLERQRSLIQPDARQITVAELPVEPAWPNYPTTLALAFSGGLVLAFLMILLRSITGQQVWDGGQAARISDLPTLGMLPHLRRRGLLLNKQEPARSLRRFPHSRFAEAMRLLVTIWFGRAGQEPQTKILMIASGLSREGRTTVAVSVAASAAMDGLRVLLLDMDLHNRGASRSLGIGPIDASFAEVAEGTVSISDAVQPVHDYDSFHVMAFKRGAQLTPRILDRFATQIVPQLRKSYDLIIMDTPPAMAVADAVRLGTIVDQALLVACAGKTSARALRGTLEKLRTIGVEVVGTVINNVSPRRYRQLMEGGYGG